jgi:hypothetical protein
MARQPVWKIAQPRRPVWKISQPRRPVWKIAQPRWPVWKMTHLRQPVWKTIKMRHPTHYIAYCDSFFAGPVLPFCFPHRLARHIRSPHRPARTFRVPHWLARHIRFPHRPVRNRGSKHHYLAESFLQNPKTFEFHGFRATCSSAMV